MEVILLGSLLSALAFGTSNIVIKKALGSTSIKQTLPFAMLSGVVVLAIYSLLRGAEVTLSVEDLPVALILGIGEAILYLALYRAFAVSNVTVASAVISVYPLFTTIFAVLFLGELATAVLFSGVILLIMGIILISVDLTQLRDGLQTKDLVKGWPWILVTLAAHTIYFPLLGNFTATGVWESKLLAVKLIALVSVAIFFALRGNTLSKLLPSRRILPFTILLGVLEILGWVGLSFASNNSEGQLAIIIAIGSSGPLVTAILAYFLLKERLKPAQYLGVLVVFAGLVLLGLSV